MIFSDYFKPQRETFDLIQAGEYFFKLVFCYVIPMITVLLIIKKEYQYAEEQTSLIRGEEFLEAGEPKADRTVPGLNFQYDSGLAE